MVGNFLLLCAAITGAITLSVIASVEVIWEAICGHGCKVQVQRDSGRQTHWILRLSYFCRQSFALKTRQFLCLGSRGSGLIDMHRADHAQHYL
jgi:hypothetical protein